MKLEWRKITAVVLLCFIIVYGFIPTISATDTDYEALYRSGDGPTIDGTISAAEWSGITPISLTFQFNDTENPTIKIDLYLTHNGSALFIGINITQPDNQSDTADAFLIYFDENDDGALTGTTPTEEGLRVLRNSTYIDLCYNVSAWVPDEDLGLTQGPSYGASNNDTNWEFIFPYSRSGSDFNINFPSNVVELSKNVGIDIEYYDADLDLYDSCTTQANGSESLNASLWDNLILGEVPDPDPNLDAIWAYIIIAMIVPLAVIVYFIVWIRRRQTD